MEDLKIDSINLNKLKTRIHKKVKFYSHFYIFLIVCLFLTFLDYFDRNRFGINSFDWVYWVWIGWGIGIVFNYLDAFVLGNMEQKMLDEEMNKINKN